jgi:hypothetical protein
VSQSFGYIPKSSTLVLSKTVALLAGISSEELRSHQFNGSPVKNIYSLILNSKMKYCKIVDVHVNTMCTLTTPRICRHGFWKYHWSCLVQSCGCEQGALWSKRPVLQAVWIFLSSISADLSVCLCPSIKALYEVLHLCFMFLHFILRNHY